MEYKLSTQLLDGRIPEGELSRKWIDYCASLPLLAPGNRRKFKVLVIGSGLAGASLAAALGEQGYNVHVFCLQDSPRRAHSVAAQGGINASYNFANDGDSDRRLFLDTIKGGDFRAREANVYRLAQLSRRIVDHCAALGVPFAREYSGMPAMRSFGGARLSRTFYARGQTGQQLLLGAYSSMMRQAKRGTVTLHPRTEMADLVLKAGRAVGITARHLDNGKIESYAGDAVVVATGGYSTVFGLSTNGLASNGKAVFRCYKRGAYFANPCFTQIHPTCLPKEGEYQSKFTLMSESLRNDGRVWVPLKPGDRRLPRDIPEAERDYFLERLYPSYGNLVPRDIASRAVERICNEGRGVGTTGRAVYLDLTEAIGRLGLEAVEQRYGNLFTMYKQITDDDPHQGPMRIYPAPHYTMGGLWVDYNLMTNIPGLFALGEANFSDHGANRLGASALMQGLCDGWFVAPYTIGAFLSAHGLCGVDEKSACFKESEVQACSELEALEKKRGSVTVHQFMMRLGELMRAKVGMTRNAAGLQEAWGEVDDLRQEFQGNLLMAGGKAEMNRQLELAWRFQDSLEIAQLMALDAFHRQESCGCHFREEYQTAEGDTRRDDEHFSYVAAWEHSWGQSAPTLHKEELHYQSVKPSGRSYK